MSAIVEPGDKIRTARVEHRCSRSSWWNGCGRTIAVGERYLSFKRGGLSTFSICSDCAPVSHPTPKDPHPCK